MEDTLRDEEILQKVANRVSLNPCFNGRYSQSKTIAMSVGVASSLNPCFNGRYSQRANGGKQQDAFSSKVLILVLMEDTLRDWRGGYKPQAIIKS